MKNIILTLIIFLNFSHLDLSAQCGGNTANKTNPTSVGIVIYSNDAETAWNALRLANFSLNEKDTVAIFLLGKGVEIVNSKNKEYDVKSQMDDFIDKGGKVLACGTCMKSRKLEGSKSCPISSMSDLYEMIRKSKVVLTF